MPDSDDRSTTAAGEALPSGPFDGRAAFAERLRAALHGAARENWRELVLSDASFADWPLGERATIEALQAWAASGRHLRMLAVSFAAFEREHARFVAWRRLWDHIIDCRACHGAGAPEVPSAIWTPAWYLRRIDVEHGRGVCGRDPAERAMLRQLMDDGLQFGRPAFAASTLGL